MRITGILIKFYLLLICYPADSKFPTRSWRKNDTVNWLQEKGVGDCDKKTFDDLLEISRDHKPPQKYEVCNSMSH